MRCPGNEVAESVFRRSIKISAEATNISEESLDLNLEECGKGNVRSWKLYYAHIRKGY